jgi:hypothetical protein
LFFPVAIKRYYRYFERSIFLRRAQIRGEEVYELNS